MDGVRGFGCWGESGKYGLVSLFLINEFVDRASSMAYQVVQELVVVFLLVATTTVLLVKTQTNCHRFVSLGDEDHWFCPHVKKQQPVVINTGLVDVIK